MSRWDNCPNTTISGLSWSVLTLTSSCRNPHGVPISTSNVLSPNTSLGERREERENEVVCQWIWQSDSLDLPWFVYSNFPYQSIREVFERSQHWWSLCWRDVETSTFKYMSLTLTLSPSSFFPAAEVATGCGCAAVVVSIASSALLSPNGIQSGSWKKRNWPFVPYTSRRKKSTFSSLHAIKMTYFRRSKELCCCRPFHIRSGV